MRDKPSIQSPAIERPSSELYGELCRLVPEMRFLDAGQDQLEVLESGHAMRISCRSAAVDRRDAVCLTICLGRVQDAHRIRWACSIVAWHELERAVAVWRLDEDGRREGEAHVQVDVLEAVAAMADELAAVVP